MPGSKHLELHPMTRQESGVIEAGVEIAPQHHSINSDNFWQGLVCHATIPNVGGSTMVGAAGGKRASYSVVGRFGGVKQGSTMGGVNVRITAES